MLNACTGSMIFGSGAPPGPNDSVVPDAVLSSPTPSAMLVTRVLAPSLRSTAMNWSSDELLGLLLAMLLPLAMQWVQRNGGVGGLLERFRQKGYSQQAASWVSTGENEPLSTHAVSEVVVDDEGVVRDIDTKQDLI